MSENLPAGITGTNGVYVVAELAQGASISFEVTYQIGATYQGTSVVNDAEITDDSGDDEDSDPETGDDVDEDGDGDGDDDDEDEVTTPIDQTFDLSLTKTLASADSDPVTQGTNLTYTITVTNEGSLDATDTEVTDTPGDGLTFVSENLPAGIMGTNGVYVVAELAQGTSISFEVTYQIGATYQGTSVVNDAEITDDSGDDEDSDPETGDDVDEDGDGDGDDDDEDEVTTPIDQTFDLSLTKTLASADSDPVTQGTNLTYTITVTNEGSLDATDTEVTDTPGDGLTFVGENLPAGITGTNGVYVVADLAQGASICFEVTYQIGATYQGTSVVNDAEITDDSGDDEDSDPETGDDVDEDGDGDGDDDDEDEVTTPIDQTFDLSLTKTVTSAGPYAPGSSVEYTVTVTNEGSLDAAGIEVTDTPQAGLTFNSVTPQMGITSTGNGSFTVANLAQGQSVQVMINYTIDATFQGSSLNNAAEITEDDGDDTDSNPETGPDVDEDGDGDGDDDDEDNVDIPVDQTPMIDIEKATFDPIAGIFKDADVFSAATAPRYIWSRSAPTPTVQWEYVVTNNGTLDLIDVVVTDDTEGVVGTIPFLAVGQTVTLTASALAQETDTEPYRNVATVVGQPVDENGDPIGDTVEDDDPSHYLGIAFNVEKVADQDQVCVGDLVTYTATVRLTGQSFGFNAQMVMVEDNMVAGVQDSFLTATDRNGNNRLDFSNGMNEEWVYQYTVPVTEDTENVIMEMFNIFFMDDFVQMVMGDDAATVTVFDAVELTAVDAEVDGSISCFGAMDGSATATVISGTAPFTYEWSDGVPTGDGSTITELSAGTYTVTVTDANGCTGMASVTLEEPTDLTATIMDFALDCFGDEDGILTVVAEGGTAPYSYEWEAAAGGDLDDTVDGLAVGTYTVTVTDANGCEEIVSGTVTQPDNALAAIGTGDALDCNGDDDGLIYVTASGGTAPYSYEWGANAGASLTDTVRNLGAGTYEVTVTDANDCETVAAVTVTEPAELMATIAPFALDCFGDEEGELTVVVTGGTAPYTYEWTPNVSTTDVATGLSAGTYDVVITDANNCSTTATGVVTEPTELELDATIVDVDCNGDADGLDHSDRNRRHYSLHLRLGRY